MTRLYTMGVPVHRTAAMTPMTIRARPHDGDEASRGQGRETARIGDARRRPRRDAEIDETTGQLERQRGVPMNVRERPTVI
jgi:hypothetical protein